MTRLQLSPVRYLGIYQTPLADLLHLRPWTPLVYNDKMIETPAVCTSISVIPALDSQDLQL